MDIQKEREAFESWFRTTATYKTLWDFISTHQTNIKSVFVKRNGKTYQNDCVQIAWEAWQAAKAQAVPEGFAVVPKEPKEEMIQARRDERRDLGAVASTYKAMLEAQEQKFNLDEFLAMEEKLKRKGGVIKADLDRFVAYAEMVLEKAKALKEPK